MRRRRNFSITQALGWAPKKASKKELATSRREFKQRVRERVQADRAEWTRLAKSARASAKDKNKLEQLFHEVYGPEGIVNPRQLPEVSAGQLKALKKLIRGTLMATKKRKTKKKNPRKGKMPAGLRAYWAKKRRKKNSIRGKLRKLRTAVMGKKKHRGYTTWTTPRRGVQIFKDGRRPRSAAEKQQWLQEMHGRGWNPKRKKRTRRSNPTRTAKRINLKGFTSGQIQKVASAIRRATGKRVRIVRP